tara:strand:- start:472 stop:816 length:345 start_codon:yes stop_codon:yes gene_type:complete
MRDHGISKKYCVMESMADSNMETDAAADAQHLFLLGITRHEEFWLLEDLITTARAFSWEDLNERAQSLNQSLPKGHRLPHLERPTTEGKAKASVNMNLTAAEVMHFAMNRCIIG